MSSSLTCHDIYLVSRLISTLGHRPLAFSVFILLPSPGKSMILYLFEGVYHEV